LNKRDYLEYSFTLNRDASADSQDFLKKSGSVDKFTHEYFDPTYSSHSPMAHKRDLNGSPMAHMAASIQIRPKLLESGIINRVEY